MTSTHHVCRWILAILCLVTSIEVTQSRRANNRVTMASTAAAAATTVPASTSAAASAAAAASSSSSSCASVWFQADQTFSRIAAGKLSQSLQHQIKDTEWHTNPAHAHRAFLRETFSKVVQKQPEPGSLNYAVRVGMAGGIAGAVGTVALYPMDSAKTLRQSSPSVYKNVRQALANLIVHDGKWHLGRAYCGVVPATLGAIPSSALYFGAYETMKSLIKKSGLADTSKTSGRFWLHSLSAASGNMLSSALFVPKEVIKQQMQYNGGREMGVVIKDIIKKHGVRGFYSGYSATLMRNIPSAVLRFCIYEELKHIFVIDDSKDARKLGFSWKIFLAGAASGAISSAMMTPVDVIKTRMATGTCPVNMPGCLQHIVQEGGVMGLYMGAGSRVIWSTAFAAIGFAMLETAKGWLGVSEITRGEGDKTVATTKEWQIFSRHQRTLEHAVSDRYE